VQKDDLDRREEHHLRRIVAAFEPAAQARFGNAEVIRELRRAAEIDPRSLNAHYNLGRALAARGWRREAVEQMEEALRIAPSDPDARQALAELKAGRAEN